MTYPLTPVTPAEEGEIGSRHPELAALLAHLAAIFRDRRADASRLRTCLGPLLRFAYRDLVHHLPASERGHHSEPWGLLIHSLDTLRRVLDRGFLYRRKNPGDFLALRDTAAVLAFMHDFGKSFKMRLAAAGAVWDPLVEGCPAFLARHPQATVAWLPGRSLQSDWALLLDPALLDLLARSLPLGAILELTGAAGHFAPYGLPAADSVAAFRWLVEPLARGARVQDFPRRHPHRTLLAALRRADSRSQLAWPSRTFANIAAARRTIEDLRRRIQQPPALLPLRPDVEADLRSALPRPVPEILRALASLEAFLRPDTFPSSAWFAEPPTHPHLAITSAVVSLSRALFPKSRIRLVPRTDGAQSGGALQLQACVFRQAPRRRGDTSPARFRPFRQSPARIAAYAYGKFGSDGDLLVELATLARDANQLARPIGRLFGALPARFRHLPPAWDRAPLPSLDDALAVLRAPLRHPPATPTAALLALLHHHGIHPPDPTPAHPHLEHLTPRLRRLLPRLVTVAFALAALPELARALNGRHVHPGSSLHKLGLRYYASRDLHGIPDGLWWRAGSHLVRRITHRSLYPWCRDHPRPADLSVFASTPASNPQRPWLTVEEQRHLLRDLELPRRGISAIVTSGSPRPGESPKRFAKRLGGRTTPALHRRLLDTLGDVAAPFHLPAAVLLHPAPEESRNPATTPLFTDAPTPARSL